MTKKKYVNFLEVISSNMAKLNVRNRGIQNLYQKQLHTFLQNTINNMDCSVFWKSPESFYLGANKNVLKVVGYSDENKFVGVSDFDISKNTKWSLALIEEFRGIDKQVCITQRTLTFEEIYTRADSEEVTMLTTKVPVWGIEEEIIGLFCVSTEINRREPNKQNQDKTYKPILTSSVKSIIDIAQILQVQQLAFAQSMYAKNVLESSDQLARLISGVFNHDTLEEKRNCENLYRQRLSNRYYLKCNGEETYLTRRELQCLAHLFFGRSAKETAAILNVAVKTVESYLEGVRPKLKCYSRSQLVELIIKNNWIDLLKQVVGY